MWITDRLPDFTHKVIIKLRYSGIRMEAERQPFSSSTFELKDGWYWHGANGMTIQFDDVVGWQEFPE